MRQAAIVLCALTVAGPARSQELEPRAYSPAPISTRIVLAGLGNSDGAYVIDPAQPIRDVEVDIAFALIGAAYVFDLWERQARVIALKSHKTALDRIAPAAKSMNTSSDSRAKPLLHKPQEHQQLRRQC